MIHILIALLVLAAPAQARPGETLTLAGQARTGSDIRPVRFTFLCSANEGPSVTGVLGVDLAVPRHDSLRPLFDFDAFEGPDARAGRLTELASLTEAGALRLRIMISGSLGVAEDAPFNFSASAARRRDATRLGELSRLLSPLTTGAGQFIWTQGNAKPDGAPITARLEVSAADAASLRALLGPCLGR